MLKYANDHPECMENFFDRKMEEVCEKADRKREAKKKPRRRKKKKPRNNRKLSPN